MSQMQEREQGRTRQKDLEDYILGMTGVDNGTLWNRMGLNDAHENHDRSFPEDGLVSDPHPTSPYEPENRRRSWIVELAAMAIIVLFFVLLALLVT